MGEVLPGNYPEAGGRNLPDISVVTLVYYDSRIAFYVASQNCLKMASNLGMFSQCHAEIGGASQGSTPPLR